MMHVHRSDYCRVIVRIREKTHKRVMETLSAIGEEGNLSALVESLLEQWLAKPRSESAWQETDGKIRSPEEVSWLTVSQCIRSTNVKGFCDKCGEYVASLHMPMWHHGWYCAACCPVCSAAEQKPDRPTGKADAHHA